MIETLYVHVTTRCNLKCDYCYIDDSSQELPLAEWLAFLRQVAECPPEKITLTGGEPLLYPHLFDIARYCKTSMPSVKLRLITNGFFVTPQNASFFTVFDEVRLSVDGDEAHTDALRGEGCTQIVKQALRLLGNANVSVAASVTVVTDSDDSLEDAVHQVWRLGFHVIRVHTVKRIGRAKKYPVTEKRQEESVLHGNCGIGRYLNIMPDGRIYPCHALCVPEFILGTIQKDDYRSVCEKQNAWKKTRYAELCSDGTPCDAYPFFG